VSGLDEMIRALIRDEIRRLIRPDAIAAANDEVSSAEDQKLQRQAAEAANRLRRARRA
jgi:ribosomal protein L19E